MFIFLPIALNADKVMSMGKLESTVHKEMLDNMHSTTNAVSTLHISYVKSTSVLTLFFQVVDSIGELLQLYDGQILIDQCRHLMASNEHNLISNDQMQLFSECTNTLSLLQKLSSFFTWSNHSTLRALVGRCSEAVNILDDFDSRLDPLQLIASYPIPLLSSDMIPSDTSTYTILAVRCDKELYKCTLQYVYVYSQ